MTFRQALLLIDANWTPAQAWAVIELLDDLRDRLHAHYQLALAEWLAEDRQGHPDRVSDFSVPMGAAAPM